MAQFKKVLSIIAGNTILAFGIAAFWSQPEL